jgi:hypothetical protein
MNLIDFGPVLTTHRRRSLAQWVNETINAAIGREKIIEETEDLKGNIVQTVQTRNGGEYLRLVPKAKI